MDRDRFERFLTQTGFEPRDGRPDRYELTLDVDASTEEVAEMTQTTIGHFARVSGADCAEQIATVHRVDPA